MTDEIEVSTESQVSTSVPEVAIEPAAEPTARDAVDRAFEAVEKASGEQDEPKSFERTRGPDGKFAASDRADETQEKIVPEKPVAEIDEAPQRFSPDAKTAWKDAPAPVKAEVRRAIGELEQGLEKYKGDATAFNELRDFDKLAKDNGVTLRQGLERYVSFEVAINKDPVAGIISVCRDKGVDPKEVAQRILGQQGNGPVAPQAELLDTIRSLRAEVDNLKSGFGAIRNESAGEKVTGFVGSLPEQDKALFEELAPQIAENIKQGRTLPDAFAAAKEAERMRMARISGNLGFIPRPPEAPAQRPDLSAQTRKGQLSVTGAPGTGSNPDARKAPSSARSAVDDAFASLGL